MAKREHRMDEIRGSWQRARDLREKVAELELSGHTDAQCRSRDPAVISSS